MATVRGVYRAIPRFKNTSEDAAEVKETPIPGIEPGPPGWEPGILTTRQYGMIPMLLYLGIIYKISIWTTEIVSLQIIN